MSPLSYIKVIKQPAAKVFFIKKRNPYQNPSIVNIVTGLPNQWTYTPKFINAYATTTIKLTGSRRKDYIEAERKTNCIHIPKQTVWHHVWEKNQNGEYTIQLVDYRLHLSTIPHAGGCKLWEVENGKSYKRHFVRKFYPIIYVNSKLFSNNTCLVEDYIHIKANNTSSTQLQLDYSDFIIDAVLSDAERKNHPVLLRKKHRLPLSPWGIDPFGDIFYIDKTHKLYFYNSEMDILYPLGITSDHIFKKTENR